MKISVILMFVALVAFVAVVAFVADVAIVTVLCSISDSTSYAIEILMKVSIVERLE